MSANRFTSMFDVATPIASAPMAYATSPALVAAVVNAGGLGFLGAGNEPAPKIAAMIDEARSLVSEDKKHLVSIGFVGWVFDMFNKESDPRLNALLEKKPYAVWLAYGPDLGKYVKLIRDYDAANGQKTYVFVNTNDKAEALRAANDWKADAIIVQGSEAGGRGGAFSPPLQPFLADVLSDLPLPTRPLVLAAGGITTPAQASALLAQGADAVVLGTRLLFTEESAYTDEMKAALVAAGPDSTVRSPAYDLAFPPGVWPTGIQARCLKNEVLRDFEDEVEVAERKAHISSGKPEYALVYAGVGVGEIDSVTPADDVLKDFITALG